MKARAYLLFTVLCLALLMCLPLGMAHADSEIKAEEILQYDGLQARLREDYPGIRSLYTADHARIDALVAEGYTVEYGAIMGIALTDGFSTRDLSVTYDEEKGYVTTGAANAVCVYSSKDSSYATNLYVSKASTRRSFAYTTTFQGESESKDIYEYGLVYAGFVAITAPGADAPVIDYVYAEGEIFGKADALYGESTSIIELSTYFATVYEGDEAIKETINASQSINRVLRMSRDGYFEIDYGAEGFLSSSSATKYETTLKNARAGFYAVRLARTTAAVNPDFYVTTGKNGQYDFYDCFLGGGLPSSDGRYAATQKANDGKTLETALYVYLDEGDNLFSYYMGTSTTVYKVVLELAWEVRAEFDGAVTESASPKYAWNTAAQPNEMKVNVTVKESGYYNIYGVYSAGTSGSGVNIDVTVKSPAGVTGETVTHNIKNTQTAGYAGTSAWYMKGVGTSYCGGNMFTTYLEAGTSELTLRLASTTANGAGNFAGTPSRFGFSVLVPIRDTHTVTFKDYDGKVISTQTVVDGGNATLPTLPKRGNGYACTGFDGVYENVTEDSVCTAAYVGTKTYYAETYETPVSITANQAHTVTTSAMAPGIYQIRTARVFTGIAGGVTVSANGRSYYDSFLGLGIVGQNYANGRGEHAKKANDGESMIHLMYVYLDGGENSISMTFNSAMTLNGVSFERVASGKDATVVMRNASATVTAPEANEYKVYAIYSYGANTSLGVTVNGKAYEGITKTYVAVGDPSATDYYDFPISNMSASGYAFRFDEIATVNLNAGENSVSLTASAAINLSSLILVPKEKKSEYTVTFVDVDGTVLKTETVLPGASATAPAVDCDYATVSWDKDFSAVNDDLTVTAIYSDYTKYAKTYEAPLALSSTAQTLTTPDMTPGIYQVRMARTCTAVSGQATLKVDGRTYSDGFIGSGLKDATTGNYNREAYAKVANNGEHETHLMFVYLDGGDSEIQLSTTAAMDVYKFTLTRVAAGNEDTIVYTPRQQSGTGYTVTPTVAESGEYTVYAIYSYKANATFGLTVNGIDYESTQKIFIQTGDTAAPDYYDYPISNMSASGYAFRYDEMGKVTLNAGQNTLTLSYTSGVVNLNSLILVPKEKKSEYTVTFVDVDGTVLKTETVLPGASATAPVIDCDYATVTWDKDFSAVNDDLTVTAVYSDYTKYTETHATLASGTPLSVNATAQTVMTTPDMVKGVYRIRLARTSLGAGPRATVTVKNGSSTWQFKEGYLGTELPSSDGLNRYQHAVKANDGESMIHLMYVVLGDGENTLSLATTYDMTLYAISVELVEAVGEDGIYTKVGTPHTSLQTGGTLTKSVTAATAGEYKLYAVYATNAQTSASFAISVTANGTTTDYGSFAPACVSRGDTTASDYYDRPISSMAYDGGAYSFHEFGTVELAEGINSLNIGATLVGQGNVFANFAALVLVPVEKDGTHTVTFVDADGTGLKTEVVKIGGAATAPAVDCDYATVSWDKDFSYITESITVTAVYSDYTRYTALAGTDSLVGASSAVKDGNGVYYLSGAQLTVKLPVDMEKGLYNVYLIGTDNGTSSYSTAKINGTVYRTKGSLPDTYTGDEAFFMNVLLLDGDENEIEFTLSNSMDVYAVRLEETADLAGANDVTVTYGDATSDQSFNYCGYLIRSTGGYIDFTVSVPLTGNYAVRMSGSTANGNLELYQLNADSSETPLGSVTMRENHSGGSSASSGEISCVGEVTLPEGTYTIRVRTAAVNTLFTALGLEFVSGDDMKILVIGNSFSLDATHYLSDIAAANADKTGRGIKVGVLYKGGSYVKKQWEVIENKDTTYFAYYENGIEKKGQIGVDEVLAMYDWDIIVLQQWTEYADKMEHYNDSHTYAFQPYMNNIAAYVAEACPTAEIMVHQTWAYEKGFNSCSTAENQLLMSSNSLAMNARVAADIGAYLYEKGLKATDEPVRVLYSGYAMQYLRDYTDASGNKIFDTTFDKSNLTGDANAYTVGSDIYNEATVSLHRDGFHASAIARYYLAAVWYNALFGESVSGSDYYPQDLTVSAMGYTASGATKTVYITIKAPPKSYVDFIRTLADKALDDMAFTVTFVDMDGSVLKTEKVKLGDAATAPTVAENVTWDKDFTYVTSDMTVTAVYSDCTEFTAKANTDSLEGAESALTDINGAYVQGKAFTVKVNQDMKAGLYNLYVVGTASYSGYPIASVNGVSYRSKIALPSAYTADGTFMFTVYLEDGKDNVISVTLPGTANVYAVKLTQVSDTSADEAMAFTYKDMTSNGALASGCGYALSGSNYVDVPISINKAGIYKVAFSGNTASSAALTFYTVDAEGKETLIGTNAATTVNNAMSSQSSGYVTVESLLPLLNGEYTLRIYTTGSNAYVTAMALSYEEELVYYDVNYYFDRNGDKEYTDDELVMTKKVMKNTEIQMPTEEEMGYTPSSAYAMMRSTATASKATEDVNVYTHEYVLPVYEESVKTNAERDASEFRVLVVADTHYYWPFDEYDSWTMTGAGKYSGGFTPHAKAQLIVDSLIAEYNTKESFDLVIFNGDLSFNDPAFNRDQSFNSVEEFNRLYLSQLADAGIPYYAVYGGHEYMNDEVWYDVFGYEKDYIITLGDTAFIISSNFVCNPEDYQSMKDTEYEFSVLADKYLKENDNIRRAYVVTHHYPFSSSENIARIVTNEKVESLFCAHRHFNTADGTYYGKPVLHCGHWARGESHNTKHLGHGLTSYVPYGSNFVSVMAGVGNEGYYNLKNVSVGNELLKDASGNTVTVKRDQNGYYLDFTVDGKTYYLFANYTANTAKKYVFKSMKEDAFYVVNDDATLSKLTSFVFEFSNNTPYLLLEDVTVTDEYLTYDGEKIYANVVDGVAREILLTEGGTYTFVPYGKIKTRIDLSLRYAGKGDYAFNGGSPLYDPIWTTYTYPVGEEAIVYHLEGTTHYFTPDETTGELILLYDYYVGEEENGFYTFTDVRLATDGNSTIKTPEGETLTAGVTIMERTVSYDYFIDTNGNRVKAATDNGGNYITVTAASLETVYRYSVYGVTKNADGSFRFIYKNDSTNDFYLVTDDGSMKRIDTFSFVTMPYFDRPSEDGVIDYSVLGEPFSYRVVERVNGEYEDIIESYMLFPEVDYLSSFALGATYEEFHQTYLRARPSDMGGNSDRTYILLSRFTYSGTLPQIPFTDESISSVVKTTGRVLEVDGGIAADFTGAGVEFNVVFTEKGPLFLDVTTAASIGGSGMTTASTGECFISVYVDGVKSVYYLAPGENSILLGELSIGTHNIRVVKENEAQYALLTFNGVRMNGTMGERPADKELYIEFVGDSITSGFGNVTMLGSGSSNQAIYRESATQSYGYLTAETLDADYSIVSRAGTGLTSGCTSQYTAMYPYADFVRGKDAYVPERKADIVVINLGTNDLGKATEANVPSDAKAILAAVRAIHGEDVTVIWAYDMMNDGCINAIMTALEGEGVHFVRLTRNTAGLYGHPNAQGHAASAEILSAYIEGLLAD